MDAEALRVLTLRLCKELDALGEAHRRADELLSEIEQAAGLVREDGSRVDDETE